MPIDDAVEMTLDKAVKLIKESSNIVDIEYAFIYLDKTAKVSSDAMRLVTDAVKPVDITNLMQRLAKTDMGINIGSKITGTTVLYSGEMGGIPAWRIAESLRVEDGYRVIGHTNIGKLLNREYTSGIINLIGGKTLDDSIWRYTSREFIQYAKGGIKTIAYGADAAKVFIQVELVEVITNLDLKGITHIDGLEINTIRELYENVNKNIDSLWKLIRDASMKSTNELVDDLIIKGSKKFSENLTKINISVDNVKQMIQGAWRNTNEAQQELLVKIAKDSGQPIAKISKPWHKMLPIIGFFLIYSNEISATENYIKDGNYESALQEILPPVATEISEEAVGLAITTIAILIAGKSTAPVMLGATASCPPLALGIAAALTAVLIVDYAKSPAGQQKAAEIWDNTRAFWAELAPGYWNSLKNEIFQKESGWYDNFAAFWFEQVPDGFSKWISGDNGFKKTTNPDLLALKNLLNTFPPGTLNGYPPPKENDEALIILAGFRALVENKSASAADMISWINRNRDHPEYGKYLIGVDSATDGEKEYIDRLLARNDHTTQLGTWLAGLMKKFDFSVDGDVSGRSVMDAFIQYLFGTVEKGKKRKKEEEEEDFDTPGGRPINRSDPILLDLNKNNEIDTTNLKNGVYFDHNNDGWLTKTAWVGEGDGLLVYDRNNNGKIDNGNELFGDNTSLDDGRIAKHGFEVLADFDANRDDVIDKKDEIWSSLKIWVDKNKDGQSDADELFTLDEIGVKALNVGYSNVHEQDEHGNLHQQQGTFIWNDGSTGKMHDVWFNTSIQDSRQVESVEIPEDIKVLPGFRSIGKMPDLHTAMTIDPSGKLRVLVASFMAESDSGKRGAIVEEIMYRWALVAGGIDDFPAQYTEHNRKGMVLTYFWGDDGPHSNFALEQVWPAWHQWVMAKLDMQTHYFELFSEAYKSYVFHHKYGYDFDASGLEILLQQMHAEGRDADIAAFFKGLRQGMYGFRDELFESMLVSHGASFIGDEFNIETPDFIQSILMNHVLGFRHNGEVFSASCGSSLSSSAIISGTEGNDYLIGSKRADVILGGDGDDFVSGGSGDDFISGGAGNDILEGGSGNDYIIAGEGDDTVYGGSGDDYIEGGSGNDKLMGGAGNDKLYGGAGNDSMSGDSGDDLLDGGDGDDSLYGDDGNDELYGGSGNDYMCGGSGDDLLDGGDGDDFLHGDDGNDELQGGAGNDKLYGGKGNDILHGGAGDDYLSGGDGDDVYVWGIGDGNDVIDDQDSRTSGKNNAIRLTEGLAPDDIEFFIYRSTFGIRIKETGETLTVKDGLDKDYTNPNVSFPNAIQSLIFADGTIWDWEAICAQPFYMIKEHNPDFPRNFASIGFTSQTVIGTDGDDYINAFTWGKGNHTLIGGAGNDILDGAYGDDTFYGGTGDDIMTGYGGKDTFIWGAGDGNDTIIGPGKFALKGKKNESVINFYNLSPEDLTIHYELKFWHNTKLVFTNKNTGETLTVCGNIEREQLPGYLVFKDGFKVNTSDFIASRNNILRGTSKDDTVDIIIKNTTYVWGKGEGNDSITFLRPEYGDVNRVRLDGLTPDDILIRRSTIDDFDYISPSLNPNNSLVVTIKSTGERLRVYEHFGDKLQLRDRLSELEFADGTVWNYIDIDKEIVRESVAAEKNYMVGTDGNDVIKGTHLADSLVGGKGDDIINGDAGNDVLYGDAGNDVLNGGDGDDVLYGDAGNDTLYGGRGNDQLYGGQGNNTYIWGKGDGNDFLHNDSSNPLDASSLLLRGLTLSDVEFLGGSQLGRLCDLIIRIKDTNEILTISRYFKKFSDQGVLQSLIFDDGFTLNPEEVAVRLQSTCGTSGDDVITLEAPGSFTWGKGAGNDVITFRGDPDSMENIVRLDGLNPDDIELRIQDGPKQLDKEFSQKANSLVIVIKETGKHLCIYDFMNRTAEWEGGVNRFHGIQFANDVFWSYEDIIKHPLQLTNYVTHINLENNDDIWVKGTDANDVITVGKNSVIEAGKGDDVIYTQNKLTSTILFERGDGRDLIYDNSHKTRLIFGESVAIDDLWFDWEDNAGNVILSIGIIGTDDRVTIRTSFFGPRVIQAGGRELHVDFIDADGFIAAMRAIGPPVGSGGIWTSEQRAALEIVLTEYWALPRDEDMTVLGDEYDNYLAGGNGNDELFGNDGNDYLEGGDGNDFLYGGDGNDILVGGQGNDSLYGGAGDDTYIIAKDDGEDYLFDYFGGMDRVRFVGNIALSDIILSRSEFGQIVIEIIGGNNRVILDDTFNDWYDNENHERLSSVETIHVGGYVLDFNDIEKLLNELEVVGTPAENCGAWTGEQKQQIEQIYYRYWQREGIADGMVTKGTDGDDIFVGTRGDDTLYGFSGNDVLRGGAGNDYLEGGLGNDTFVFGRGFGYDIVNAADTAAGKRDIIHLEGLQRSDIEFIGVKNRDFVIRIKDSGETITVINGLLGNASGIQAVTFDNGDTIEWSDLLLEQLSGSRYSDVILGTKHNDHIFGLEGDDCIEGGKGDDILVGGSGNDVFVYSLGDGNDIIDAYDTEETKRDIIRFRDLNRDDVTFKVDDAGNFIIRIIATGETLTVLSGAVDYAHGIQAIEFADGTEVEYTELMEIWGTEADDVLLGGAGNDFLYGGDGNDTLHGGKGNDYLNGGKGDDVYLFNRGDGCDVIYEKEGNDRLIFGKDITLSDLHFRREHGKNLVIQIVGTTDLMRITDWFIPLNDDDSLGDFDDFGGSHSSDIPCRKNPADILESIQVGDLTLSHKDVDALLDSLSHIGAPAGGNGYWSDWQLEIVQEVYQKYFKSGNAYEAKIIYGSTSNDILTAGETGATLYGLSGDDKLYGSSGDDILIGGEGNDYLEGGAGNDIYEFGPNDGHDIVNAYDDGVGKHDRIQLRSLNQDDIELFAKSSNEFITDLIIRVKSTGATLTIEKGLYAYGASTTSNPWAVLSISFADGSTWSWADICAQPIHIMNDSASILVAAPEGSFIIGNNTGNNIRSGGAGDNQFYGGTGNDRLEGGAGDDKLYGGEGDDILHGGSGNDYLDGWLGDDIFLFGRGDGHDHVNAYDYTPGKKDRIRLIDLKPEDVELLAKSHDDNCTDLIICIKDTGETMTIGKALHAYGAASAANFWAIHSIEFSDGSAWSWEDICSQPIRIADDSHFEFWAAPDGANIIGNNSDSIIHGGAGVNKVLGGSGNDVIRGGNGNDEIHGGAGNDKLYGGEGDDIISGGPGNDYLDGWLGNDIFVFGRGDGHDVVNAYDTNPGKHDSIRLVGLNPGDIELFASAGDEFCTDLVLRIKDTGESVTVEKGVNAYGNTDTSNAWSVSSISFADGTIWDCSEILKQLNTGNNTSSTASMFSDGISYAFEDSLADAASSSVIYHTIAFDEYSDNTSLFSPNKGADTISYPAGNDHLLFSNGIGANDLWFSRSGSNLVIDVIGSKDRVNVESWFSGTSYQVETIRAGEMELASTQMEQLIQAMASFGAPAGVDGQWTEEQKEGVNSLIAGYWRPYKS